MDIIFLLTTGLFLGLFFLMKDIYTQKPTKYNLYFLLFLIPIFFILAIKFVQLIAYVPPIIPLLTILFSLFFISFLGGLIALDLLFYLSPKKSFHKQIYTIFSIILFGIFLLNIINTLTKTSVPLFSQDSALILLTPIVALIFVNVVYIFMRISFKDSAVMSSRILWSILFSTLLILLSIFDILFIKWSDPTIQVMDNIYRDFVIIYLLLSISILLGSILSKSFITLINLPTVLMQEIIYFFSLVAGILLGSSVYRLSYSARLENLTAYFSTFLVYAIVNLTLGKFINNITSQLKNIWFSFVLSSVSQTLKEKINGKKDILELANVFSKYINTLFNSSYIAVFEQFSPFKDFQVGNLISFYGILPKGLETIVAKLNSRRDIKKPVEDIIVMEDIGTVSFVVKNEVKKTELLVVIGPKEKLLPYDEYDIEMLKTLRDILNTAIELIQEEEEIKQRLSNLGVQLKVLVVDNDIPEASFISQTVQEMGFDTQIFHNGEDLLEYLNANMFKEVFVVILDFSLPSINGIDLSKAIKTSKVNIPIPVILLLDKSKAYLRENVIGNYADTVIVKPIDKLEIKKALSSILMRYKLTINLQELVNSLSKTSKISEYVLLQIDPYKIVDYKSFQGRVIESSLSFGSVFKTNRPLIIGIGINHFQDKMINFRFLGISGKVYKELYRDVHLPLNFFRKVQLKPDTSFFSSYIQENMDIEKYQDLFDESLLNLFQPISNIVGFCGKYISIIGINWVSEPNIWDAEILRALGIYEDFIKAITDEIKEVDITFIYIMQTLARAAEELDEETGNHIVRVGEYAKLVSEKLGFSESFANSIYYSAQMHDIGKLRIPREILRKPGKLSAEEFEIMKTHTIAGAIILGDHPRLKIAREIALYHHERFDGTGYPYGLKGDAIPIHARITTLADIFDALRSRRVYKPEIPFEKAYEIIVYGDERTKPQHFDPEVLYVFKNYAEEFEKIYQKLKD